MLIAAATFAAAVLAPAPLPSSAAPMVISVTAAADIPNDLVTATLREADAIWRAAGFHFAWERASRVVPAPLHVIIGGGASPVSALMPLAWIGFDELGAPTSQVYVSHRNAVSFMGNSRETVGHVDTMTIVQKHTYLARAMGRALAHEIGHFLLASRVHSEKGLMTSSHTAVEFFSPDRRAFTIDAVQRRLVAERFSSIYVAWRG